MSDVVTNKPGQFGVYKKSAAGQVSLILPTFNDKGWLTKTGGVMIEATKSTGTDAEGNPQYDWTNSKITFSLGMNDLALLFNDIEAKLVHEYKGAIKGLQFKAATDPKYAGTYQLLMNHKDADGSRNVMVPLSGGEMQVLTRLLDSATPRMLGW